MWLILVNDCDAHLSSFDTVMERERSMRNEVYRFFKALASSVTSIRNMKASTAHIVCKNGCND